MPFKLIEEKPMKSSFRLVEDKPYGRNIKDIPESEFIANNPYIEAIKQTSKDLFNIGKKTVGIALEPIKSIDRSIAVYPQQIAIKSITGKEQPVTGLFAGKTEFPSNKDVALDVGSTALMMPGGSALITTPVKAISKSVTTPINWVKKSWGNLKKVKSAAMDARNAVLKETANKISSVREEGLRKGKISSAINKKYADALAREENGLKLALDKAEEKYVGNVSKESLKKSSEIRKDLPILYKQKSQEYGEGLNKLLIEKPVQVSKSAVLPTLEESLMNHGILSIDDSGRVIIQRSGATRAETNILNEYIKLRNLPDDAMVNVGELLQSQSLIKPKYNKVWSSSDHLQSEVSEGISSIVAQKSPEVASYRKSYAPFLEWKKAVNKEFRPFAGKFENKKGSQILSKYADINKRLTQDEANLMNDLQDYIGKDYTKSLKSLRKVGKEISSRKDSVGTISKAKGEEIVRIASQRKDMIDNEIQSHIDEILSSKELLLSDIDKETQVILDNIRNTRILVGTAAAATAGPSLIRYIKNRIAYQVFGITDK